MISIGQWVQNRRSLANGVPREELYEGILRISASITAFQLSYSELMPNWYTNHDNLEDAIWECFTEIN